MIIHSCACVFACVCIRVYVSDFCLLVFSYREERSDGLTSNVRAKLYYTIHMPAYHTLVRLFVFLPLYRFVEMFSKSHESIAYKIYGAARCRTILDGGSIDGRYKFSFYRYYYYLKEMRELLFNRYDYFFSSLITTTTLGTV